MLLHGISIHIDGVHNGFPINDLRKRRFFRSIIEPSQTPITQSIHRIEPAGEVGALQLVLERRM